MRPPEEGAYLVLSAAAVREFFDEAAGLRLRTVGDVITMKGVRTTSGADVVSVEERGRGGLFAHIESGGRNSAELLQLLRQAGYRSSTPYFLLRPRPREWVGIEHWTSQKPPINQPFMRVWMSESRRRGGRRVAAARTTRRQPEETTNEVIDWRQVRRVLIGDRATLARPATNGRSNPQRAAARRNLEQFERLVEQILPERERGEDPQPRIDRLATQLEQANRERDAAHEELVALQRVLDHERQERGSAERRKRRREFQKPPVTPEDVIAAEEAGGAEPPPVEESRDLPLADEPISAADREAIQWPDVTPEAQGAPGEGNDAEVIDEPQDAEEATGGEVTEVTEEAELDEAGADEVEPEQEQEPGEVTGEETTGVESVESGEEDTGEDQPTLDDIRFPEKKD